mmetsp:Transcript_62795/g.174986  ORF Transcript_62795/g.174986 Transcript_62795/m.174986 type:complete len:227 (+) Transcript_62795:336-1016(+)
MLRCRFLRLHRLAGLLLRQPSLAAFPLFLAAGLFLLMRQMAELAVATILAAPLGEKVATLAASRFMRRRTHRWKVSSLAADVRLWGVLIGHRFATRRIRGWRSRGSCGAVQTDRIRVVHLRGGGEVRVRIVALIAVLMDEVLPGSVDGDRARLCQLQRVEVRVAATTESEVCDLAEWGAIVGPHHCLAERHHLFWLTHRAGRSEGLHILRRRAYGNELGRAGRKAL